MAHHPEDPEQMRNRRSLPRRAASTRVDERGTRVSTGYDVGTMVGKGSFGTVNEARCLQTGDKVAVKRVLQDPRFKNRELDVLKELDHPNIVTLRDYFYTEERDTQERYLNVVMEHIPETVHRVLKTFVKNEQAMPLLLVRLYLYQLCRSIGYLHAMGVCHRDIKPQNLLVDSKFHVLKLCDFGSAKKLVPTESSVAYICSRYYRAPELMIGATQYTTSIDMWSIGCVMGELLLGKPLFAGETSVEQLVKIIKVLGTPTRAQMYSMNPQCTEFKFPEVKARDWKKVFGSDSTSDTLSFISSLLKYEPTERLKPFEALAHPFFDELRNPNTRLPGGGPLPELFSFKEVEVKQMTPAIRAKVTPEWFNAV